jgi:hypothetical protein
MSSPSLKMTTTGNHLDIRAQNFLGFQQWPHRCIFITDILTSDGGQKESRGCGASRQCCQVYGNFNLQAKI